MRYSNLLFFFALSMLVAFSSCKKDEISDMDDVTVDVKPELVRNNVLTRNLEANATSAEGLDLGCFSVDLPFDLIVDGATVTINDETDLDTAISDDAQYVDFAYPLAITYPDGETASVADGEELGEAFASCIPDIGWTGDGFPAFLICDLNSCYQMVYPVNLVDGDGNVFTANDENEFIDLIANNPELYFEFPVSLTDTDGNTVTAENDDDLFALLADCDQIYDPGNGGIDTIDIGIGSGLFGCYELQYPVDVVDWDGNVTTINDENEFNAAWLNGDFADFAFPLTLINEDGDAVVFNNHEELCDAVLECYGGNGGGPGGLDLIVFLLGSDEFDGDCYAINYPFSITEFDTGAVTEITDSQSAMDHLNTGTFGEVVLPTDITVNATGETVTIETAEQFFLIFEDCQ